MIELTFFTPEPHVRRFTDPRIVLGRASVDLADLLPSTLQLDAEHLVFTQDAQGAWAINQANDPFVLLEDRPFSKRKLEAAGTYRITLQGLVITCQVVSCATEEQAVLPAQPSFEDDLTDLLQAVENFPVTPKPPKIKATPLQPHSPNFQYPLNALPLAAVKLSPSTALPATPSKQAESLKQTGSPQQTLATEEIKEADPAASMAWKLVLASGATTFLLVALISLTVYGVFTETNSQTEFLAAHDIADVGMALVHARLNSDNLKNYNWSDPEFLRTHLAELLGEEFPVSLEITPQGYLKRSPYFLRLYTNQDISQFIIVAQPEPSLWYWLIQPHIIYLDSVTMQLHTVKDARTVNRILAQPNLFHGTGLKALEPLIAQSSVIPLRTLSYKVNRREFAPPRQLQTLRPGAENRIYNAPRYHRLGESLFKMLTDGPTATSKDNSLLSQKLQAFSEFHNMVLYTIGSLHTAQKAVKSLHRHFPEEQFLIGHMTLDKKNHTLLSSHLVDPIPESPTATLIATSDALKHPLQIKFEDLAQERKRAVEPLTQEMLAQISSHLKAPSEHFYETMETLLQRFKEIDSPCCQELRSTLAHFYMEYVIKEPRIAFPEFAAYTESAGLTAYLPREPMRALPELQGPMPGPVEALDLLPWTKAIKEASSLHALDRSFLMAEQWLLDQQVSDRKQVTHSMQLLKKTAKLSLERLLMSSQDAPAFQERQRPILLHLLDTLLSVPPHEKEIYLKEFERRLQKETPSENSVTNS